MEESPVLFGRAGQMTATRAERSWCRGDWGVLSKCKCMFLSYACDGRWVVHVFPDAGGRLGGTDTACCKTQCEILCDFEACHCPGCMTYIDFIFICYVKT